MPWSTAISHVTKDKELIRGYDLKDLIAKKSFVEVIFLVLKGELPTEQETRMMNALFTSVIDHGIGVASAVTARTVASTGNALHAALAAGILALGNLHGSAIEDAARFFQENKEGNPDELVRDLRAKKVRLAGYGHRVLDHDPRTDELFAIAKATGCFGKHCAFALEVHTALNAVSSKKLPLNVDGAMAAIISDMGFPWQMARGFFIIGRVPGLVAHITEEMTSGEGLRRLAADETEYTGSAERVVP